MAESSGNKNAANMNDNHGSCIGSYGLFQIACFWFTYYGYSSKDYYDPIVGLKIAEKIVERQGGYNAWTTYVSGAYQSYL